MKRRREFPWDGDREFWGNKNSILHSHNEMINAYNFGSSTFIDAMSKSRAKDYMLHRFIGVDNRMERANKVGVGKRLNDKRYNISKG